MRECFHYSINQNTFLELKNGILLAAVKMRLYSEVEIYCCMIVNGES